MAPTPAAPAGRGRGRTGSCGRSGPDDRGTVTAETAVVLPVLLVVLVAAVWVLACVSAQLRCVDAARSAARLLARGEAGSTVLAAAREAAPAGASVDVRHDGDSVVVVVSARVRPPGTLAGLPSVDVRAQAAALDEGRADAGAP